MEFGFWKKALLCEKQGRRDTNFCSCDLCLTEAFLPGPVDKIFFFFFGFPGDGCHYFKRNLVLLSPLVPQLRYHDVGELNLKSPGEKRPSKWKKACKCRWCLPQLSEVCHPIISNYNCVSFFNVFYADIQVANEAGPWFMIPIVATCWA